MNFISMDKLQLHALSSMSLVIFTAVQETGSLIGDCHVDDDIYLQNPQFRMVIPWLPRCSSNYHPLDSSHLLRYYVM